MDMFKLLSSKDGVSNLVPYCISGNKALRYVAIIRHDEHKYVLHDKIWCYTEDLFTDATSLIEYMDTFIREYSIGHDHEITTFKNMLVSTNVPHASSKTCVDIVATFGYKDPIAYRLYAISKDAIVPKLNLLGDCVRDNVIDFGICAEYSTGYFVVESLGTFTNDAVSVVDKPWVIVPKRDVRHLIRESDVAYIGQLEHIRVMCKIYSSMSVVSKIYDTLILNHATIGKESESLSNIINSLRTCARFMTQTPEIISVIIIDEMNSLIQSNEDIITAWYIR